MGALNCYYSLPDAARLNLVYLRRLLPRNYPGITPELPRNYPGRVSANRAPPRGDVAMASLPS